jgi:hypothetical protein
MSRIYKHLTTQERAVVMSMQRQLAPLCVLPEVEFRNEIEGCPAPQRAKWPSRTYLCRCTQVCSFTDIFFASVYVPRESASASAQSLSKAIQEFLALVQRLYAQVFVQPMRTTWRRTAEHAANAVGPNSGIV